MKYVCGIQLSRLGELQEEMTSENKPEEGTVYLSRPSWLPSFS